MYLAPSSIHRLHEYAQINSQLASLQTLFSTKHDTQLVLHDDTCQEFQMVGHVIVGFLYQLVFMHGGLLCLTRGRR